MSKGAENGIDVGLDKFRENPAKETLEQDLGEIGKLMQDVLDNQDTKDPSLKKSIEGWEIKKQKAINELSKMTPEGLQTGLSNFIARIENMTSEEMNHAKKSELAAVGKFEKYEQKARGYLNKLLDDPFLGGIVLSVLESIKNYIPGLNNIINEKWIEINTKKIDKMLATEQLNFTDAKNNINDVYKIKELYDTYKGDKGESANDFETWFKANILGNNSYKTLKMAINKLLGNENNFLYTLGDTIPEKFKYANATELENTIREKIGTETVDTESVRIAIDSLAGQEVDKSNANKTKLEEHFKKSDFTIIYKAIFENSDDLETKYKLDKATITESGKNILKLNFNIESIEKSKFTLKGKNGDIKMELEKKPSKFIFFLENTDQKIEIKTENIKQALEKISKWDEQAGNNKENLSLLDATSVDAIDVNIYGNREFWRNLSKNIKQQRSQEKSQEKTYEEKLKEAIAKKMTFEKQLEELFSSQAEKLESNTEIFLGLTVDMVTEVKLNTTEKTLLLKLNSSVSGQFVNASVKKGSGNTMVFTIINKDNSGAFFEKVFTDSVGFRDKLKKLPENFASFDALKNSLESI